MSVTRRTFHHYSTSDLGQSYEKQAAELDSVQCCFHLADASYFIVEQSYF
jgi:hypothetical protein